MNLWIFGCSHATKDFNLLEKEDSWTSIVSKKFNLIEKNIARSGASNDEILENIINNHENITYDDLVIVLMTFPERVFYEGKNLSPSNENNQWWYKVVNSDDYYFRKFLSNYLSIVFLLQSKRKIITFVDPSLLFQNNSHVVKSLIKNNSVFLPKITLSRSFPLGMDKKHLSKEGHIMLAEFFINLIDFTNKSN